MKRKLQKSLNGKGKRIAIVASRFNDFITKELLKGCLGELKRSGVKDKDITVAWVPGSFEIPVVALKLAQRKAVDAVICLGAIIRGETIHFDLIAYGAAYGIAEVALKTNKPIIFGVLATETLDQAYKRCGIKGRDNKGCDCARSAVDMIDLVSKI